MDYLQKLKYHYKPQKGWINDPNGLVYFDGYYHVFYQHAPDYEVPGKQPICWGHARTKDFLNWEELPVALYPDCDYDNGGCWSGTAIVKENVKKARLENSASFFQKDACDFLKHCDLKFDIVFLDPPYSGNFYESCLKGLYENNLLNTEGVVAMEWDSELSRPAIPPCYEVVKERRYGRVMITLLVLSEKGATNG